MERVTTLHLEPPNDRQKLFFQCRKKYIAFGGARGGGKSWAVRTKAKLMALGYPSCESHIVDVPESGSIKYFLDENKNYCVPKRALKDICIVK